MNWVNIIMDVVGKSKKKKQDLGLQKERKGWREENGRDLEYFYDGRIDFVVFTFSNS